MPGKERPGPVRSIAEYPLPDGKLVLSLEGNPPNWVEPSLKALTQLLVLPPNWDSYGGRPVDPANVWAVWELLKNIMTDAFPIPSIVPTSQGGVQVEWHVGNVNLEIESRTPGRFFVSFEDARTGEVWEKENSLPLDPDVRVRLQKTALTA
jgi:hypothetical protein